MSAIPAVPPATTDWQATLKTAAEKVTGTPLSCVSKAFAEFDYKLYSAIGKLTQKSFSIMTGSVYFSLAMLFKAIHPTNKPQYLGALGAKGLTDEDFHTGLTQLREKVLIPLNNPTSRNDDLAAKPKDQLTVESCCLDFINAVGIESKGDIQVDPSFINHIRQKYQGQIFCGTGIGKKLNEWVNSRMYGLTPNFFDLYHQQAPLFLICSALIAAPWAKPFAFHLTKLDTFQLSSSVTVPNVLINNETIREDCLVYRGEIDGKDKIPFDMYEKHYAIAGLSRVIFVPHDPSKLAELENELTPEKVQRYRELAKSNLAKRTSEKKKLDVEVRWPMKTTDGKFSELAMMLEKELGFPLSEYDPSILKSTQRLPTIKDILHQSKIIDNHEGTIGAAVTAAILVPRCVHEKHELFKFDAARPHFDIGMMNDMPIFRTRVNDDTPLQKRTPDEWK